MNKNYLVYCVILVSLISGFVLLDSKNEIYAAQGDDHTDIVASVKASLIQQGVNLSGPCGAFQIVDRVALELQSENVGLLAGKTPGQNGCTVGSERYAADFIAYPNGDHYDVLFDGGTKNDPIWKNAGKFKSPLFWHAAIDPVEIPVQAQPDPGPGPGPGPGPNPEPIPGSTPPELLIAKPNNVRPGEKVEVIGLNLTPNIIVKSLSSGLEYNFTASLNAEKTRAAITLPDDIPPGNYAVTVYGVNGEATAPNLLTVLQEPIARGPSDIPEAKDFGDLIENIFQWALWLVGAAIFVNFLWAGILWLSAAGRPGPIGQAKEKMTNALIGAIILLASYLILNTINPDLVKQTFILPGL